MRRHGASPEADYARARLDGLKQQVATAAPPPGLAPPKDGLKPTALAPLSAIRGSAAFGGIGGDPFEDANANPMQRPITGLNVNVTRNPANRNQLVVGMLQAQWGSEQPIPWQLASGRAYRAPTLTRMRGLRRFSSSAEITREQETRRPRIGSPACKPTRTRGFYNSVTPTVAPMNARHWQVSRSSGFMGTPEAISISSGGYSARFKRADELVTRALLNLGDTHLTIS